MTLVDSKGTRITLSSRLGQGGEGAVYAIVNQPALVAKVYNKPPARDRTEKLTAMVYMKSPDLVRLTSWPTELLLDRPGGTVTGFLMQNASGCKEVHKLYSPKSRAAEFQAVDWRFLIAAAANMARAFAVVHRAGHVIGDVNHSSVMIAPDSTVKLIDCDSFQISANNQRFPCDVAEPLHTAPELHGQSLKGFVRTPNHDNFGLAVLIFELLFMGRHPFAGAYLGSGDLSLEQKIAKYLFAYSKNAHALQVKQPPATLDLAAVGPTVAAQFERAFSRAGTTGGRPSTADWVSALTNLQSAVKGCSRDKSHFYLSTLSACPWCEIEAKTGITLFTLAFTVQGGSTFNLALTWESICKVPSAPKAFASHPNSLTVMPPSPDVQSAVRSRRTMLTFGIVFGLLVAGTSFAVLNVGVFSAVAGVIVASLCYASGDSQTAKVKAANHENARQARAQYGDLVNRWNATASEKLFFDALSQLGSKKAAYQDLPALKQRELAKLQASLHERQLHRFLDGFKIAPGQIHGVGAGRCATLSSFGVETAADVTYGAVRAVPGFGDQLTANVLAWKQMLERRFVFNPSVGIDKRDLQKLDADIDSLRSSLEKELQGGAALLEQTVNRIEASRRALTQPLEAAARRLAQAEADIRAL